MNRRLISLPELLVAGLAAYRLTRLYQQDTIAEPIRDRVSDIFPAPGATMMATRMKWERHWNAERGDDEIIPVSTARPRPNPNVWTPVYAEGSATPVMYSSPNGTFLGDLLNCRWCTGIWASFAILIARRTPLRPLVDALAVASVAMLGFKHIE